MNKTIQISGQTIELPFTEAEYQKIISFNDLTLISAACASVGLDEDSYTDDLKKVWLAIGLHLAEKEKQDQVSKYKTEIDELNTEVDLLKEKVKELEGTILVRAIRANTNSL